MLDDFELTQPLAHKMLKNTIKKNNRKNPNSNLKNKTTK